jgi:uncharacterized protein with ParB-like and HNH nuclease domain
MSQTLFSTIDYPLAKLLQEIEYGQIGLPDIQRPFVWSAAQVRDLFDSMYKGFPVGYLLFWANSQTDHGRRIGTGTLAQPIPRLLIVDGQQRLTSLFAVFKGKPVLNHEYEYKPIQIAFRPRDSKFEVSDAATQRDPEYIADISQAWTQYGSSYRVIKWFLNNLTVTQSNVPLDESEEQVISGAIDRLFDLANYTFTALEISSNVDEEQVAEIFVRINSKGVQLRQSDFILTLLSVFWDEGRKELEQFSRDSRKPSTNNKPSSFNHFIQPAPEQLLRTSIALGFGRARLEHVYSILRGKDLNSGLFSTRRREEQFTELKKAQAEVLNLTNWHDFVQCLVRAGVRSSAMITGALC